MMSGPDGRPGSAPPWRLYVGRVPPSGRRRKPEQSSVTSLSPSSVSMAYTCCSTTKSRPASVPVNRYHRCSRSPTASVWNSIRFSGSASAYQPAMVSAASGDPARSSGPGGIKALNWTSRVKQAMIASLSLAAMLSTSRLAYCTTSSSGLLAAPHRTPPPRSPQDPQHRRTEHLACCAQGSASAPNRESRRLVTVEGVKTSAPVVDVNPQPERATITVSGAPWP